MTAEEWSPTTIEGVMRRTAVHIADERGAFTELWRASLARGLATEAFVQANMSRSREGVLRGMHFHRRQADLWMLLEGRVLAATTDVRASMGEGSGQVLSQVIELTPGASLYIPRLVAHGFWAIEETVLLYLVSNEYDGTDEHGFVWNDPAAAIGWPAGQPILSERDRTNPTLRELADL
jgi:dTDP-4-dehydrorhamnose 3,5-epimerase